MHQTSPGVERAVEAARAWAGRLGSPAVRLPDLLLGLLDEEEGRPAVLLERLGLSVPEFRQAVAALPVTPQTPAPPLAKILDAARDWSLAHRGDPGLLTDAVLWAVLHADAGFAQTLTRFGLDPARVHTLLTANSLQDLTPPAAQPESPPFAVPDSAAETDAARILDVNLNRSREALRVLEDYCRFALNDRFLTEQLKGLRHALAGVSARLAPRLLLSARETLRDVGTAVSAAGEYDRGSPAQVAAVNLKRLQESLRSLEEFGKVFGPDVGRELEAVRYRAYTLERALVLGSAARERLADARLYVLLTGSQCAAAMDWVIERAAAGGADVFQLREKGLSDRELLERARDVRRWTRKAGKLFVVNDRPDIARLAEADGVHLGQDDLPVMEARRVVGPDVLVGVSTHSVEQLRRAVLDGADYVGVGPTFPSTTKAFDRLAGLEFVAAAAAETSLPAFALGGITPQNVARVAAAGLRRVAVAAAVTRADDPEPVARALRAALVG